MSIQTFAVVVGLIFGIPAFVASLYAGYLRLRSSIEVAAYTRAKSEMVLKEATDALAEKDIELGLKTTALESANQRLVRYETVQDDHRGIISNLSSALSALGGETNQEVISS